MGNQTVAQHYNHRVDMLLGLTLFAMALFGLFGNGFVLYVLARKLKRRINYLTTLVLFQLALTDFIGVIPTSFIGYCLLQGRDFPSPTTTVTIIENVIGWLGIAMPLASIYIVTILSFGRCIAIYRSFDYPVVMSERNSSIMCSAAWLLAFAVACLPYYGGYQYVYDPHICFMYTSLSKTFPNFSEYQLHVVYIVINVLLVILPALFMISCCAAVIIRLKIKAHKASLEDNKDAAMAHAANTVLLITVAFIACYGPYFINTLINLLGRFDAIDKDWMMVNLGLQKFVYVTIVVHFLCIALNSCINPCIYYLRAKKFREDMALSVRRKIKRFSTSFTRMSSFNMTATREDGGTSPIHFNGERRYTTALKISNGNGKVLYRQLTTEMKPPSVGMQETKQ